MGYSVLSKTSLQFNSLREEYVPRADRYPMPIYCNLDYVAKLLDLASEYASLPRDSAVMVIFIRFTSSDNILGVYCVFQILLLT